MAILETKDLTRRYGTLTAVDNASISVEAGEVFGLLGPNGAGKTTMIKMLTTLLPPTSGQAWVADFDVRRRGTEVRRSIGYVPQAISADGQLTGYENLLILAKLYDIPRCERETRIRYALSFMGLADSADKMVSDYSGGMIRRLEIAQSMMHRPRVMFLDEPTLGLDPGARAAVWQHIKRLQTDFGMTILLTTNLMEEADSLCNRVAIMNLGKVAVIGTPDDLKKSINKKNATLDEVFIHYTGEKLESPGGYRETWRRRRTVRRLG
ncbi:MAG: ATP-binding cassette domain-containing protein [Armatimonadetes bacterium]|nr:ATP-binding cassette domain-containing protein [Armatimonadota bacterium]